MRFRVVLVQVVTVVGRGKQQAVFAGHLDEARVDAVLFGQAVVLELDEEVLFSKKANVAGERLFRLLELFAQEKLGDLAAQAGGAGAACRRRAVADGPTVVGRPAAMRLPPRRSVCTEAGKAIVRLKAQVSRLGSGLRPTASGFLAPTRHLRTCRPPGGSGGSGGPRSPDPA